MRWRDTFGEDGNWRVGGWVVPFRDFRTFRCCQCHGCVLLREAIFFLICSLQQPLSWEQKIGLIFLDFWVVFIFVLFHFEFSESMKECHWVYFVLHFWLFFGKYFTVYDLPIYKVCHWSWTSKGLSLFVFFPQLYNLLFPHFHFIDAAVVTAFEACHLLSSLSFMISLFYNSLFHFIEIVDRRPSWSAVVKLLVYDFHFFIF